MKVIIKLFFALCVIMLSSIIVSTSCDAPSAGGGGGNSAGDDNGGGNLLDPSPTTTLEIVPKQTYVKFKNNIVYVNAAGLAGAITTPLARPDNVADDPVDANKRWDVMPIRGNSITLFDIKYPGDKASIYYVSRAHVTIDTIAAKASSVAAGFTTQFDACSTGESNDNVLAASPTGAHCRLEGTTAITYGSYLATVFAKKTNPETDARGLLACQEKIEGEPALLLNTNPKILQNRSAQCEIGVVNNGNTGGDAAAQALAAEEIDDDWVSDDKIVEVDLYAIGINVHGKSIPEFFGASLTEYNKAIDNDAFIKMLRNNEWGELRFKVRIVATGDFPAD